MRDPKVSNVPNESKLQRALMPNSRMFLLFLIVFAVLTFFFSDRLWLSIGEGVIILLLIIYSVIMRARKRRTLERYIESVTYDTESARNNTLQNFPLPMAVFRPADSQVIWANQNFFDLCGRHKPSVDMRITDVIPEFSGRWLLEGNTQCPELLEYQGHKYQIHGNLVRTNPDDAASYMGITYWVDVTDYEKIRLEYYASRPVIAVIVIDNYDELIRGLTDRKRNELRDAIEDKLLQWCEGKGGFFRRYDRDRYLYVFEERHLDELRENKFASLLDSVRSVASPSGIRATVSVGIGRDGDSLDENYNFAILGTEMALSRGGDQAVVKNRVTFEFFGGRGGEVERRTKVKSRVMANALSQLIQDSSKVYVMGHKFSDLDTLGAAAGVCCIARKLGTPCRIVVDANKTAAGQLRDRMLHVPEYAKAFLSPQEAYLHADSRTLLVVVDTNRPDQVENHNLLEACTRVAVIDYRAARRPISRDHELPRAVCVVGLRADDGAARGAGRAAGHPARGGGGMPRASCSIRRTTVRTGERHLRRRRSCAAPGHTSRSKSSCRRTWSTVARYKILQTASIYRATLPLPRPLSRRTASSQRRRRMSCVNIAVTASMVIYPMGDGDAYLRALGSVN
ncbi:MAG: DHH family phosphoesterase [Oscillospiraceae bacterium]